MVLDIVKRVEAIQDECVKAGDWNGFHMCVMDILKYEKLMGVNPEGKLI